MKIVLLYVPVIHKGYIKFFDIHSDADEIYIWGESLISRERNLRKEIRALNPKQVKTALSAITERTIQIAELDTLSFIIKSSSLLVMPDDEISHNLVDELLLSMGLKYHKFVSIFLRWDGKNAVLNNKVIVDETVSRESVAFLLSLAEHESENSSDWWRRVGAVLFDNDKNTYFASYNKHVPTEYTPYIDGDVRAAFSKGVNIDLSTVIHAEAHVLAMAAKAGVKTGGLRLLVTTFPCPVCAKLIAACDISELFFIEGYSMVDGEKVLRDAEVKIIQIV